MDRIKLSSSLEVSRLIYGLWRLTDDDTSTHHVQAKIEACLDQGITTLDHADIYGAYSGEEVFGNCLRAAPHLKDEVEIITKCGIVAPMGRYQESKVKHYNTGRAHIDHCVDQSLRFMGTEKIDLLLIHRPDPFMDHHETGAALDGLVRSGKVLNVGVSNFKPHDWQLLQSAMSEKLVTNQIEISVIANQAFTDGDIAFLQGAGIAPMAWSPLAGGALFDGTRPELVETLNRIANAQGTDIAAIAIAWLLAHPANILPVLGTNNLNRVKALADALNCEIDRQTWFEIYTAATGQEVP